MKTLFGMIITMTVLFAGAAQAGQLMSMEDCRDALYEGGGAHTLGDATAVCYERRDEAFVGCVQDRYQDSAASHTFASATSLCRTRIPDQVRICQDRIYRATGIDYGVAKNLCQGPNPTAITNCVVDAKRLGFNIGRSVQLCQWTTEKAIYLCAENAIRRNGYQNEQALMQCYSEYDRGELDSQGLNARQIELERQKEAARRAAEQRAEQQRREDQARRDTYRPPAPPPPVRPVRPGSIPVVDKGQPVTPVQPKPAKPAAPAAPSAPAAKPAEPVKPVAPVKPKPAEPAKPSAPYQDDSELPPSVRPGDSNNKPTPVPAKPAPAVPVKPAPTSPAAEDCKATNTCGNDGVIVDLPNL